MKLLSGFMKLLSGFLLLFFLLSCNHSNKKIKKNYNSVEDYNTFDKNNHLQPFFAKAAFDSLHSWHFGWAILEPINIAKDDEDEKKLTIRFSPGQKALYFIWYLDAQVTNGGFIQFYWNNYRRYLPPIKDGLTLIGDRDMLNLIKKVNIEYLIHQDKFTSHKKKDDMEHLYDSLQNFDNFDSTYYAIHDKTMDLIEKYARQNPAEFVKFKGN